MKRHDLIRNRGIATQMMQIVAEQCQRIGLPNIILYVQSDNPAAIRLYERFGFSPTE